MPESTEKTSSNAGWWKLPGNKFDGSKDGVIAEINKAESIPTEWRAAIVAEINRCCGTEFNSVRVDAICTTNPTNIHITIVPSKRL